MASDGRVKADYDLRVARHEREQKIMRDGQPLAA